MSDPIDLVASRAIPDLLKNIFLQSPAWTRLEPQSVSGDPTPGIEARVHDPLWALARQWQLAEFEGEDAGTPIKVEVSSRSIPVTAWQGGNSSDNPTPHPVDPRVPLDVSVEREPVVTEQLGLRNRAEAGAYLLELLEDAGFNNHEALLQACPLAIGTSSDSSAIPAHIAVPSDIAVIASAVPDGVTAALQIENEPSPTWLNGASQSIIDAANYWRDWFRSHIAPVDDNPTWIDEQLEYRFSMRLNSDDRPVVLHAQTHQGGAIDWYSFDQTSQWTSTPFEDEPLEAAVKRESFSMIATPLRFSGMPVDRYWQFEDGQVHLGRLDAQPHDLARLCVAEFAMVYGNDWLVVPLTVHAGTLTQLDEVAYTTTFGERVPVQPADDGGRRGRFRMYAISKQSSPNQTYPGLLIPPSAVGVIDGKPLEEVTFLRDEMANMAWAVERTVQGRSGDPRSRRDEERPVNRVENMEAEADLQYMLSSEVPRHWIPFVPVSTGIGQIALRKGTMTEQDDSLGKLLSPTPFTIRDEEIPREGVRVARVPSLARAADGQYLRWITRRVSVGQGEGSSGYANDGTYRP